MRAQITLRNGVQIEVDVSELTAKRSAGNNRLVGLEWTTPDVWTSRLHSVDAGEVVAIVMLDQPKDAVSE